MLHIAVLMYKNNFGVRHNDLHDEIMISNESLHLTFNLYDGYNHVPFIACNNCYLDVECYHPMDIVLLYMTTGIIFQNIRIPVHEYRILVDNYSRILFEFRSYDVN